MFRKIGITFAVYGEGGDPERLIPFDVIPRVFSASEWNVLQRGVVQRAQALNAFIADVYGAARIVKEGIVPAEIIFNNEAYEPVMRDFMPPKNVYSHISGIDVIRTGEDGFYVLEDNCRTPSGVSYVLENRRMMARLFPELFMNGDVAPVEYYPDMLRQTMESVAPMNAADDGGIVSVILTPGHFNSAYYEHSFLADEMGIPLVEGSDLFVDGDKVYMRTTRGPQRVHVIYRRIDDAFLDPEQFNPSSMLGVPGLIRAYKAGGVTIINAPGTGVADDKAIYCFVEDMIRFYLSEEPVLKNVETFRCSEPSQLSHVLENLEHLVVKEVHGSGGYGMLIGPKSTAEEREQYAQRLKAKPSAFIAQPTLSLSTCPTLVEEGIAERHVDFRPFVLTGDISQVTPGGLTRVALREGSLVVNSSQGGGVKDTWVLTE
ncbi:MAG: circularly permuted type 2 ATP-grasp protein [Ponticaulis sp.]|nr:circularly permuted type 2 ATP-grasp protein [Ponticaulis sp.]MDF1681567.1 circularly permuted type 2 ATP-grasp protein [Ponticaulis sp.]